MKYHSVTTHHRTELINITGWIRSEVQKSGIQEGICVVFVPHTTAAVTINESADPAVVEDLISHLDKAVPKSNYYRHSEGNSDSHIKASLFGSSETLLISDGDLVLGTWQGVFFCEFDGPRTRKVFLTFVAS
ncbi:MAG: secondary thiamine-phosphate synthase enzyme YjbQ [Candidatus Eremiobacteraeota bacterium]|nr:secondary thiamine-phosphate synthase enzyme YjbQ [Candidatus Eremiobacteraeota bacterium]